MWKIIGGIIGAIIAVLFVLYLLWPGKKYISEKELRERENKRLRDHETEEQE